MFIVDCGNYDDKGILKYSDFIKLDKEAVLLKIGDIWYNKRS